MRNPFRPEKRNASRWQPRGDFSVKEVMLMRPVRVRIGRFSLSMPAEVILYLLAKIFVVLVLLLHL
jgi:hypothetical protein